MSYKKFINPIQSVTTPVDGMVANNGGGYSFTLDSWKQFDRFLILGTIGGTYYVGEDKHTENNLKVLNACLANDPERYVNTIVDVSVNGRAVKQSPAIFAFALAFNNKDAKPFVEKSFNRVIRTGTHLFEFVSYVTELRGWGRALKRTVGSWYKSKTEDQLVYQVTKYQNREGWSHRDVLRLAHVQPETEWQNSIFKWIISKELPQNEMIRSIESLPTMKTKDVVKAIEKFKLTREMIPTEHLKESEVWSALLPHMPITALIRNLGAMTSNGTLTPMSENTAIVVRKLTDKEYIKNGRVHPLTILNAYNTYVGGHGMRGSKSWEPVTQIVDALNTAFYLAFDNIEPIGKNVVYAIDVSASMTWSNVADMNLTPRVASAAMAMALARVEPNCFIGGFSATFQDTKITKHDSLGEAVRKIESMNASHTNPGTVIEYLDSKKIKADVIVVLTDNEVNAGNHWHQLVRSYRKKYGVKTKVIIVGMVTTEFTMADPNDPDMLDVVGFDTSVPDAIREFVNA